jgi:hypothetical protein
MPSAIPARISIPFASGRDQSGGTARLRFSIDLPRPPFPGHYW